MEETHERLYFSGRTNDIEMTPSHLLEQYADFIDAHVGMSSRRIVDFGCGVSDMAEIVGNRGGHYTGVEFSRSARSILGSRGIAVVAELEELGPQRFDIALMIEVIEHLPDPAEVLRSIRAVLNPRGSLFVVTPNSGSLNYRLRGDRWPQAALPAHVTLLNYSALKTVLQRHRFSVAARQRFVRHHRSLLPRIGHAVLQAVGLDGGLRLLTVRGD